MTTTTSSPYPVISQIDDEWFGFKLFGTPGEIVTNFDHISQAIKVILTTTQGSVPHHPDWFSDLNNLIDKPVDTVRASLIEGIQRSLGLHEPRIDVLGIAVAPTNETQLENLIITVRWRIRETELTNETVIEI